jgi:hypothetical protein
VEKEDVINNQEQDIADAVESFLGVDESDTASTSTTKVVYRGRCSCTVVRIWRFRRTSILRRLFASRIARRSPRSSSRRSSSSNPTPGDRV